MPKVIQLDPHVADLIAAGEVVERPASAVKELVENAIDAGAKTVTIEIENGGMRYIRITDDGCGMLPEDARKAFLRHATSKLRTASDLAAIGTLGFRGEALAAISAVSRIDLLTRAVGADEGVSLHLDAGQITSEQPVGCPEGTTIIVRELFYNTPARMKFMKSDSAEGAAVFAAVQQQSLAHPEISFRFIRDGQEQLHTAGDGERMGAIYAIFGRELAKNMLPVDSHWENIRVRGYVSAPTATRGNRSYEMFFVNGRFVKSRMLGAALEEAYKNQIMTGRFPACVLEVQLPVQAVDVNVHPAKTEVKFLSERAVFDAVHYGVLSALGKATGRPEMKLPEQERTPAPQPAPTIPETRAAAAPKPDFWKAMPAAQLRLQLDAQKPATHPAAAKQPIRPAAQPVRVFADEPAFAREPVVASPVMLPAREVPVQPDAPQKAEASSPEPAPQPEVEPEQQTLSLPEQKWRVVGEAMDTYIIVEQGDTLFFIDKHAAHERILFEKLKSQKQGVMMQLLMEPAFAELSQPEAAAAIEHPALLTQLGFALEEFGGGTLRIRQIPAELDLPAAQQVLQAVTGKLLSGQNIDPDAVRDELLHTIACKAAIKAGYHTEPAEREHLVREVLTRDDIRCCPHGRPVCIALTKKQLEKQFKRA